MKAIKKKKFPEPVIFYSKQKNSTVLVVDKTTSIRFLDQQTLDVLGGFKAKINHNWYKNKVVEFSKDGLHFAVISEDVRQSRLYDTKDKKVKIKINRHHGEVTCVAIDPRGNYFFSGGEDGRTFVCDIKSSRILFTLPTHVDSINDIKFSKKSYLVATASYDKKIQVFNYATMTPLAKFKASDAVMKVEFIDHNTLCSVDKKSVVAIWDISEQKTLKKLSGIHDDISQISTNEHFLFLGTNLGFVIVYDLKNYEQVSRKFLKVKSRITCLEYDYEQDLLVVADESGGLLYYDIYKDIDKIEFYIKNDAFGNAFELVKVNPLLEYTDMYKTIEDIWDKRYKKAIKLLQESKKDEAMDIFGTFTQIPKKNTLIKKLLREYEEFDKFVALVKSEKYALAYSIVNQHPSFKESNIYKAMEKKWRKLFLHAQKISLDPRAKDKIKYILAPYRGVSEKTKHIQEMMVKSDIYTRFKNSIIKKDFKMVFELIRVNPFLKEFPEYFSIINFGDNLYINTNKLIKSGDIHKAVKILRVLVDFPDFRDEANRMLKDIDQRDKLFTAINDSNFVEIYKVIDGSFVLSEINEAKPYIELWNDDIELAKNYAMNGDVLGIDGVMDKYSNVSSKYMSIASVYSLAYISQIENAIKKKTNRSEIKKAIKSYILYFGLDDYILSTYELFLKHYDDVKLSFDSLKKGSKKQWRRSMRVTDILE